MPSPLDELTVARIARVVACQGEMNEWEGDVLSCRVGDRIYETLREALRCRVRTNNGTQVEFDNRIAEQATLLDGCLQTSSHVSDEFKQMLELRGDAPHPIDCNDLPFTIYDSHLHAYDGISALLKTSQRPITIVRFDAHADSDEVDVLSRANYVTALTSYFTPLTRIKEVITVAGAFPDTGLAKSLRNARYEERFRTPCTTYMLNGIPHTLMRITGLPTIDGPSILDIDLDGCEWAMPEATEGGYSIRTHTGPVVHANQGCITMHPRVAAQLLRERVREPMGILVATERGFRNTLFHRQIEYDFLSALAGKEKDS